MKSSTIGLIAGFAVLFYSSLLYSQDKQQDLQEKIKQLIEDLGHEDYFKREEAQEELKKIGKPALEALEEATKDKDPERAARARRLVEEIREQEEQKDKIEKRKRQFGFAFSYHIMTPTYELKVEPTGEVTLKVKENGETKEYQAENLEEFKKKYPELADKYLKGIKIQPVPRLEEEPFDFEDLFPIPEFKFPWMEELRKRIEELKKEFEERFGREFPDLWKFPEERVPQRKRPSERPIFGITTQPVDEVLREQLELQEDEGIIVTEVKKDSPAERLGLKENDIITKVNGEPVKSAMHLRHLIHDALEGKEIVVEIIRKGERTQLKAKTNRLRREPF